MSSIVNEELPKRLAMTDNEEALKDTLINMLINKDGKYGPYKHPKYAERLVDFDVFIVPVKDDPELTACVSFEDAAIYISKGFLTDEKYFYQLNVIIRHEMAHNLLQHQIRMMKKIGDEKFNVLAKSSFFELLNWIEDFEISNRKYTTEDKATMRKLWLNGKFINCLVTEDHRKDWMNLSVEEMYDRLVTELDILNKNLIEARTNSWTAANVTNKANTDGLTMTGVKNMAYMDRTRPSFIWEPAEEFFKKSKFFKKNVGASFQKLTIDLFNKYKDSAPEAIKADFEAITDSKLTAEIKTSTGITVLSPQEKLIAVNVLQYFLGNRAPTPPTVKVTKVSHSKEYVAAYNEIIKKLGSKTKCDDETLADIAKKVMHEMGEIED